MRPFIRAISWLTVLTFIGGWGSGCATTPDDLGSGPLSQQELQLLMKRSHDPRRYGLTVYQSNQGPVYTRANRLHPGQVVTLPFMSGRKSTAPVIEIFGRKNLTSYRALVDSSSKHSWIDLNTFRHMKAIPLAPPAIGVGATSVASPTPGFVCTPDKLVFDTLHMETPLLWFQASKDHLGALVRDQDPDVVGGLMGCDMMKAFQYVTFDFENRSLELSSTTRFSSNLDQLIGSVPFTFVDGRVTVQGALEGKPTGIIVDVAGAYSLALPEPLPASMKLVSIGDIAFRNPPLISTQQESLGAPDIPRIGRELLVHYRVTLDRARKLVHFERP